MTTPTTPTLTDTDAQRSREQWFRYLDVIEPFRGDLHVYCQRLTQTIWDAEDLVQETLLRGFAMTARGDLHGEHSPVRNAKAYLFRVATNQWIDHKRKLQRELLQPAIEVAAPQATDDVLPGIERALQVTSAQEFAAFVLKEGYDFTLGEIADFVGTSVGTVKSALSRSRHKIATTPSIPSIPSMPSTLTGPVDAENRRVAQQFADAINRQDLDGLMQLMADSMSIVVCNVGGGRGKSGVWTEKSVRLVGAQYREYQGEALVILTGPSIAANDIVRIEASDGQVVRLTDYCYAPETLAHVAAELGVEMKAKNYHQPAQTLVEMIATTTLPWRD